MTQATAFDLILNKEIQYDEVYSDKDCVAFKDIAPQAPIHVLVIPKGAYTCYDHFLREGSSDEILGFNDAILQVIQKLKISPKDNNSGYRVISNAGAYGAQDVPHLHMHILSGRFLGRMLE